MPKHLLHRFDGVRAAQFVDEIMDKALYVENGQEHKQLLPNLLIKALHFRHVLALHMRC
jgi:hypothetical protein